MHPCPGMHRMLWDRMQCRDSVEWTILFRAQMRRCHHSSQMQQKLSIIHFAGWQLPLKPCEGRCPTCGHGRPAGAGLPATAAFTQPSSQEAHEFVDSTRD